VHGQHHGGTEQQKERVGAGLEVFHLSVLLCAKNGQRKQDAGQNGSREPHEGAMTHRRGRVGRIASQVGAEISAARVHCIQANGTECVRTIQERAVARQFEAFS
jgi:hypothetical protein